MLEPLSDENLFDHLTAFADRELDAAQSAAVWRFLSESPDRLTATRWLETHERLTLAARQSLHASTPDDFRAKIAAIAREIPASTNSYGQARRSAWQRASGYVLAIAASLIAGIMLAGLFASRDRQPDVLPPTLIADVRRIHAECARLPAALHDARFQEIDAGLSRSAAKDFGNGDGTPDLASQGYHLIGAGPCPAASMQAVHLLYRSLRPGSVAAVSIFVQHDAGQYPQLKPAKVYRITSATSPFPVTSWRRGGDVYFLMADTADTEMAILEKIHPTRAVDIESVAMR